MLRSSHMPLQRHVVRFSIRTSVLFLTCVLPSYAGEIVGVTRVIDPFSFTAWDGRTVRLLGVGRPVEMPPGSEVEASATEFLRELIERKAVELETESTPARDATEVVAYVHLGETFVNEHVIEQGHGRAVVDPEYERKAQFMAAEVKARSAGRGIWRSNAVAAHKVGNETLPKLKFASIAELFARIPAGKSEFTSTSEYRSKRAAALPAGTYSFVVADVVPKFDADTSTFVFDLPTAPFLSGAGSGYVLASRVIDEREDVRSNEPRHDS